MNSTADLAALRARPQVAYPGYEALRAAGRRRDVNPADIPRMTDVIRRRGVRWCRAVLGWPASGDLHSISLADANMLLVADARGLDPPEPAWLPGWEAAPLRLRRERDQARRHGTGQVGDLWEKALADSGVPADMLQVRENTRSRRGGHRPLLHVIPLIDVRSARRLHLAGQELCADRRLRVLGDPVDAPATCTMCVRYTAVIRPAQGGSR